MNKKIVKKLVTVVDKFNKADKLVFNLLSESAYDKYVSPIMEVIDDLSFLVLFGQDYMSVHEAFNSPGNDDGKRPVAWRNGFIPEKILDELKYGKDTKKKVDTILDLMKELKLAESEFKKKKK